MQKAYWLKTCKYIFMCLCVCVFACVCVCVCVCFVCACFWFAGEIMKKKKKPQVTGASFFDPNTKWR